MNILKNTLLPISLILVAQASYAQTTQTTVVTPSQPISWTSKSSSDVITINNGSGNKITITIHLDKPASSNIGTTSEAPGVTVNNCGDTKHIDAGSSAVCTTSDSANPVSFSSDSPTAQASGTYTISQN